MHGTPLAPATRDDLVALIGKELGPTQWHDVTQDRVDAFAAATGDHQWIHVNPTRAQESPLGSTIAHGLYTLSLGPGFCYQLISFDGFAHALNYEYDGIRFPAVLPVGSRVRMALTILGTTDVRGGIQLRMRQTFQREGHDRPAAVAESVTLVVEID
jgi:acyl dehydratase